MIAKYRLMKIMKFVKRIIPIMIGLVFIMQFMPSGVADQTSDTFNITVTGEFIWIDITNASWDIGTVSMSSMHWTNESGITFIADMDNCTVNTDLKLQVTADGADWSASTAGNPADADTYCLNASIDTWGADDNQVVTASATTISSDITAGDNETFDLLFYAPTSTSVSDQQSITVTATLAKH